MACMRQDISNWTLIFDIIRAGLAQRSDDVARTAQDLAERVEHPQLGAGEPQVAKRIRRIVADSLQSSTHAAGSVAEGRPMPAATNSSASTFMAFNSTSGPVDSESRSPFVDALMVSAIEQPILSEMATAELERFVELQRYRDDVLRAGLPMSRAMLLYGPPGCGKTTAARYVAGALGLPLLTVRLDAVISSYLGTTAKNLRTVFDYAAHRGGVLFLDEFDALAKMRDDANEVGEIKRIVNGLIQNLDMYPDMPLIAATNHEHLLDPAIWRRFDSIIALPLPGQDEREALLRQFVERVYTAPPRIEVTDIQNAKNARSRTLRAASVGPSSQRIPTTAPHLHESRTDPNPLDDEELAVMARLTDTCSGADLERFVVRARQEVLLADLRASRGKQVSVQGSFAVQLALEIWHARQPDKSLISVGDASSSALRPALVHFIDSQTRERPSARVVSALTGIPASTVARIRQQRDRNSQEHPESWGEAGEMP